MTRTAQPLGTYIGGKVLNTSPIFENGQLHNYALVFMIGGLANLLALFWSAYFINESNDILQFNLRFNRKTNIEMNTINTININDEHNKNENTMNEAIEQKNTFKLLFKFNNIKDMFSTCLKKRDNYVRLQIWLLFVAIIFNLLSSIGPMMFLYQFVQKVYSWNSETYSNASALGNILNALATLIIVPILIKVNSLSL